MPLSSAQKLAEQLPWTYDNCLRMARAYLDDPTYRDIPADLIYCFASDAPLLPDELDQLAAELVRMRIDHFAALKRPLPPRPREPIA